MGVEDNMTVQLLEIICMRNLLLQECNKIPMGTDYQRGKCHGIEICIAILDDLIEEHKKPMPIATSDCDEIATSNRTIW